MKLNISLCLMSHSVASLATHTSPTDMRNYCSWHHMLCKSQPFGNSMHCAMKYTVDAPMHVNTGLGANHVRVTSSTLNNSPFMMMFSCSLHTLLSINMRANTVHPIGYILCTQLCGSLWKPLFSSPPHIMCQIAGCFPVEYFIFSPLSLPLHDRVCISPSQPRIICSPIAVLSSRVQWWVHFLPLQGEFVGLKKQQGFHWLHTVFPNIYSDLSLTALKGRYCLRKDPQRRAVKYCTQRRPQFDAGHYTVWGKDVLVQNFFKWRAETQEESGDCVILNILWFLKLYQEH